MKIEMGESICFSWLKHTKGCQIVQQNWKVPSLDTGFLNEKEVKAIFNEYKNKYKEDLNKLKLFGNNNYLQLIKQGEVDVLGLDIYNDENTNNNRISYHALDVAFHENGLNYGSKEETTARVLKKYIRTAMSLIALFDTQYAYIYFASPKISSPILDKLQPCINNLNDTFNKVCNSYNKERYFKFELICNDDFMNRIMKNIYEQSVKYTDTNELFMRSVQLINASSEHPLSIEGVNLHEKKIGKIVTENMFEVIKKLPKSEIENLCNAEYCKKVFDINFIILKPYKDDIDRLDELGRTRYYVDTVSNENVEYLVCNQWYEKSKDKLLKWINKFM